MIQKYADHAGNIEADQGTCYRMNVCACSQKRGK